jgi:hypothetical protein
VTMTVQVRVSGIWKTHTEFSKKPVLPDSRALRKRVNRKPKTRSVSQATIVVTSRLVLTCSSPILESPSSRFNTQKEICPSWYVL